MSIRIHKVSNKQDRKAFVRFPLKLYKNNPNYIPALSFDELNTFDETKNPAFDFCEAELFLAYKEDIVVGRVALIINQDANRWWKQEHARFGWLDAIDDPEVFRALFETLEQRSRAKGMHALKGPLGFCDLDHEGMLVEGFDQIGTMATIYNYPYYPKQMENMGYQKDVDWKEFLIDIPKEIPDRYERMAQIVAKKYQLHVPQIKSNRDLVRKYGKKLFQLWNDSYKVLYGYAPLTDKQVDYYIGIYLSMIKRDLICLVVNAEEEVIGMGIAIPSLSKALQKANGRLFPTGAFHLLRALKKNDRVDLYLMGIRPDYQGKGINALIFADLVPKFIQNGYLIAETNPELEDNGRIQALWSEFGPRQHKRRRIYIKHL